MGGVDSRTNARIHSTKAAEQHHECYQFITNIWQ